MRPTPRPLSCLLWVTNRWTDKSPFNRMGGDASNGVGHFRAKDNAGSIIYRMLQTDCTGLACAQDYRYGPKSLQ